MLSFQILPRLYFTFLYAALENNKENIQWTCFFFHKLHVLRFLLPGLPFRRLKLIITFLLTIHQYFAYGSLFYFYFEAFETFKKDKSSAESPAPMSHLISEEYKGEKKSWHLLPAVPSMAFIQFWILHSKTFSHFPIYPRVTIIPGSIYQSLK